jgi:large subunit ribosomal protein L15
VVGPEELHEAGLVRSAKRPVVILAAGDIAAAITIRAHRFSTAARQKIENAGGTAEVIASA